MSINHICSFGSTPHTASFLKVNELYPISYPFDWININLDNIIHCIDNDFKIFLNKDLYFQKRDKMKCGHKYYNEDMFQYHNPLINDGYNYLVRCVNKFKDLLNNLDKKLFIILYPNCTENIDISLKNDIFDFNNKLSNYTNNYILLCIHHKESNNHNYIFNKVKNIDFLEINTKSKSNGTLFINNDDNIYLYNIIKKTYKFKIKKENNLNQQYINTIKNIKEDITLSDDFNLKNIPLPNDFHWENYIKQNKDLSYMNEEEAKNHYIKYGFNEKRKYKIETPIDFDPVIYLEINKDLENLSYDEAINHYKRDGFRMNKKYNYLPDDFDWTLYVNLNEDLIHMDELQAKKHYNYFGYKEDRIYKNVPIDFYANIYLKINNDLEEMSEEEAKKHYLTIGIKQNRKYKNIPDDFDANMYILINKDLSHMNESQAMNHYNHFGFYENRKYKVY